MYFHNRAEAGIRLASELHDYRYKDTAVMALTAGGVLVGEQIARKLHTTLSLLMISNISLPGDDLIVGTMDHTGLFTYNEMIPVGEMEEIVAEMHGWIEEAKLHKMYEMTRLVGEHGLADPNQLARRNVIIVTDGLMNGLSYFAAKHFLKQVHTLDLVAAVPVAPYEALETIRPLVDELHYINVPSNFISVPHYYTDESEVVPADVLGRIDNIVTRWI
jgi:putative phosphoribosyl transferase